ncbi:hydrogenase expression protein HypF [Streptomyces sp. HPF1205]|uniref:hydrogenase expression protein HypF n=1 Tax=Streptomyces sp. HPF1205 TaxID=2873262 RepID=UPI001CEC298F|nr:hydrogenase expression protein HypF [Streptomyces sp. HPF1205]
MLGDQTQPAESDGARNGAPSGPRHAAPRKSLLTKLHVPAGKAVALAAMPTAVLMGMGFTPHLAQADEMPKSKFKAGPCVSQTDTPTATPSPSASGAGKDSSTDGSGGKATPSPSASPSASPSPTADSPLKKALPKPATTTAAPKPSASPSPAGGSSGSTGTSGTSGTTSSAPSSSSTTNPLDPLGLGNLLGGLLGTDKSAPSPSPTTPSPSPSPTKSAPAPSASPSPSAPAKSAPDSGTSATPKATPKQTGKSPAETLSKTVKDLAGTSATATPKATPTGSTAASGGSQSYPCPTYDAKALADAQVEGGIPLLPDDPWTLKSSKLTLHGLQYDGIVQVRTWSGKVKDVLKFTATGIDIDDLWQTVNGPNGGHTFVKAAPGSTSTIRNGTVTMYTESLSGNLLGLIPITFTPKAPPPLTLPELFFTHVTVVQAGQFGGDLHVPGMQVLPGRP